MSVKYDKLLLFLIIKKGIGFLMIFLKNDSKKVIFPVDRTLCSSVRAELVTLQL